MLFSSSCLHRFWVHLWRLQTLKNRFSLQRGANVHKTDVFQKSAEKSQCWLHVGMAKPVKIDKRSCLKLMFFSTLFFCCFLLVFVDFGSIWGGPGRSKNDPESLKIALGASLERVCTFGMLSVVILKRFQLIWVALGRIAEVFCEDLALILRTIRKIFDELLCLRTRVEDQGDEGQIIQRDRKTERQRDVGFWRRWQIWGADLFPVNDPQI